uniref:Uncharacterized protein n=1 Tax=Knipowitschia caucasica TaxID=637954 RepID=A0AAV2LP01_KNICA
MTLLLGDTWPQLVPVAKAAFRSSSVVGLMPAHLPRLTALSPTTCVQEAGCAIMSLARLSNMSRWCGRARGPGLWCGHCPELSHTHPTPTADQLPRREHLVQDEVSVFGQRRGGGGLTMVLEVGESLASSQAPQGTHSEWSLTRELLMPARNRPDEQ